MSNVIIVDAKPLIASTYSMIVECLQEDAYMQAQFAEHADAVMLDFYNWAVRKYFYRTYGTNVIDFSERVFFEYIYPRVEIEITKFLSNNCDSHHLLVCTQTVALHAIVNGEFLILLPCQLKASV